MKYLSMNASGAESNGYDRAAKKKKRNKSGVFLGRFVASVRIDRYIICSEPAGRAVRQLTSAGVSFFTDRAGGGR